MQYCADTWYLLKLHAKDQGAMDILYKARDGKDVIIIPLIVYAEATKKLFQKGLPKEKVNQFFDAVETSEKVQINYPDKAIAKEAAHIALTHSLSLMDAFVAATSKLTGCHSLLSADSDFSPLTKKGYIQVRSW